MAERLGRHFARSEPRRRAVGCLRGLLSDTRRKNGWQLAEYLGRGHVSDIVLPQGGFLPKQNAPGTPVAQGSAFLREHAKTMQKHETVWLMREQAECVADALLPPPASAAGASSAPR